MTIALVIAIVAMVACIVMLTYKINTVEEKVEKSDATALVNSLDTYTKKSVDTANVNFNSIVAAFNHQRDEIDSITDRMNAIAADIKRLDEEITRVKKDEREIRSYYVNFREPKALPVYNAGVPWAKDYPCNEEHE